LLDWPSVCTVRHSLRRPRRPSKVALRWDEEAALSDLQLGCRRCALEVQGENGHVELYA